MVAHVPPARPGDPDVTSTADPAPAAAPTPAREVLQGALLHTVDLLHGRRAAEIDAGYIDGYVALNWLEWHGGSLRLTVTGDNIRRQLKARQA